MTTATTDRHGNFISKMNVDYDVIDFNKYGYNFIESSVSKSVTTESVYVYYKNTRNDKIATVRFSNHSSNSLEFGDVIDGNFNNYEEILFKLGLMRRIFVPNTHLLICKQCVAKKNLTNYEEAELTIQEMYALGEGADLSKYVGKIAKGSNYLICSDKIQKYEDKLGEYKYEKING